MNTSHTPDAAFVDDLETQLRSTLRRRAAFSGQGPRRVWPKLVGTVVLMLSSMLLGGAGTYAVTHEVDEATRELLVTRHQIMLELAELRYRHHVENAKDMWAQVDQGLISEMELLHLDVEKVMLRSEVTRSALNLEEVRLSGQEPNDGLSAPRVDGRDFVSERLSLELEPREQQLKMLQRRRSRLAALVDQGAVSSVELGQIDTETALIRVETDGVHRRLSLRTEFLNGELNAAEVEFREFKDGTLRHHQALQTEIKMLLERRDVLQGMHDSGHVSARELREIDMELKTQRMHTHLMELELQILEQRILEFSTD